MTAGYSARFKGSPRCPPILRPLPESDRLSGFARESGAPAVKLFPASVGGSELIQSIVSRFPDLRLIPTGGITADKAAAYLAAGAVAVGVGGWLTRVDSTEQAELFLYPGDVHLLADSSLPSYDEAATKLMTSRVLDFLSTLG